MTAEAASRPADLSADLATEVRVPPFSVVSGRQVQEALAGREQEVVALVEHTYLAHERGESVNPPSYFLRFPDRPSSRIIALPAALQGEAPLAGLKWISSFPENIAAGVPRASAVLILNDAATGYPFACMESSIISATRTAASAALGADVLTRGRGRPRSVGVVGTGLIARYVLHFLVATGWDLDAIDLFDTDPVHADGLAEHLREVGAAAEVRVHEQIEPVLTGNDLVVFATVAGAPHVSERSWFDHHPVVLHVSLRDLSAEIVLDSVNVLDDVEHCLKADTSPHLAEQLTGGRDFVDGTLAQVIAGEVDVPADRTVVFSPFGLGVLDLAVGRYVHAAVEADGDLQVVPDFFHELRRHG